MQVFNNNQDCKFDMTRSYIYCILKENSYIIQFISKLNQFELQNMSMLPPIENLTHKLDIGNSKKKINIQDIFSVRWVGRGVRVCDYFIGLPVDLVMWMIFCFLGVLVEQGLHHYLHKI